MKKVIVTGGAGFIGSHLVDALIHADVEVIIIDNLYTGRKENINIKAKFICEDLLNINYDIFKGVDVVFHCAALPSVQFSIEHPEESNKNNLTLTLHVLECSRKAGVKKVILSSTCAVYGDSKTIPTSESESVNPLSPYGAQKYMSEIYCKLYSDIFEVNTVCLRYFNVYGYRMPDSGAYCSVISIFKKQYHQDIPFTIYNDGFQRRDFVHVQDVVRANISAALKSIKHEVLNVGSGKNYSVNEIAKMFGKDTQVIGSRIEPRTVLSDINKIKSVLEWEPKYNLEEFIKEFKNA